MNISSVPYIVGGVVLAAMALTIYLLFGEVKKANEQIGSMKTAIDTISDVNKKNLEDFLASKEFQGIVEGLRVDREKILQEIASRLDSRLDDYQKATESDTEVKDWDGGSIPAWIRNKNAQEVLSAKPQ